MSIAVIAPPTPPTPPGTPGALSIAVADSQGANSPTAAASLAFTVSLSAASSQTVTVDYSSANGTGASGAVAGIDYTAVSGTLTFTPGEVEQTFFVTLPAESVATSNKTFFIDLANPSGAGISQAQAIGTIISGAGLPPGTNPGISIGQIVQQISPTGAASFVFNVTLLQASSQPVRVTYLATIDSPGTSFAFTSTQTVTFAPGTTTQQITVQAPLDAPTLSDLSFSVAVIGAQSAFIAAGQAALEISGGPTFPAVYLQLPPATLQSVAAPAPALAPVFAGVADDTRLATGTLISLGTVSIASDTMSGGDIKQAGDRRSNLSDSPAGAAVDAVLEAFLDPHLLGNAQEQSAERLLQSLADFDEMHLVSIDLGDDVVKKTEGDKKRERVTVNRLPTDSAPILAASVEQAAGWFWTAVWTSASSWQVKVPLGGGALLALSWRFRRRVRSRVAALWHLLGL